MSACVRRVLVAVLGLAPVAVVAATATWWWSSLPDLLPTHWPASGPADDFDSRNATLAVLLSLAAAGALLVVGGCAAHRRSPVTGQAFAAIGGFLGGVAAAVWVSIAGATLLAPTAAQATFSGWWVLLVVAAVAWAWIALPLREPSPPVAPGDLALSDGIPFRAVAPGERVSFSRIIGPTWLTWFAAALLMIEVAIALAVPAAWPGVVIVLAVTVLFARLEITVDRRGLRLVAGLVRLPIKRIRVDQVVRADAEDVLAMDWGGWGYRILPGRSALVVRSGPALVVTLANQRRFAATIDDPAIPAGLLNGLAAARQPH